MSNKTLIKIGKGNFTWDRKERVSDRYGAVHLLDDDGNYVPLHLPPVGTKIELFAKVLIPKQSPHIGDLFHCVRPSLPYKNELIKLGEGVSLLEFSFDGDPVVCVKPLSDRENLWLDIRSLYRAHSSYVELSYRELD